MDQVREACGVFGVYAPGIDVAKLVFDGLFALQHRGQEAAGMAVSDGETITVVRDLGLVTSVFDARTLASLQGDLGLGHVRYSTSGPSNWANAQPVYRGDGRAGFALGHNGNLTNVSKLEAEAGMLPGILTSDSELVAELLAREFPPEGTEADADFEQGLSAVLPRLEGAFSLGVIDMTRLVAVRDPNGFRPLCLGQLPPATEGEPGGWVIASESPALDVVGASFVRELEPGEMVVIDADGPRSLFPFDKERIDPRLCIFEFVYFARPDTRLYGREVHAARRRMGEQLAEEAPADADLVIGVPDSGVPAAEGFAARSGITFGHGLVKNRYIGRTFIAPTQQDRIDGVRRKLNPLRESIAGRRLIVVDDSIVRGTTTAPDGEAAARGGGGGDPPTDLVAAVPLAVLLRDRHAGARGAAGGADGGRRDRRPPRRRLGGVPVPRRAAVSDRRPGRRLLLGLPYRQVSRSDRRSLPALTSAAALPLAPRLPIPGNGPSRS